MAFLAKVQMALVELAVPAAVAALVDHLVELLLNLLVALAAHMAVVVVRLKVVLVDLAAAVQSVLFGPEMYVNSHLHTQVIIQMYLLTRLL